MCSIFLLRCRHVRSAPQGRSWGHPKVLTGPCWLSDTVSTEESFMTREDNGLLVNAVAAHVAGEQSRKALFLILKVLYLKDFERSMPRDTQFETKVWQSVAAILGQAMAIVSRNQAATISFISSQFHMMWRLFGGCFVQFRKIYYIEIWNRGKALKIHIWSVFKMVTKAYQTYYIILHPSITYRCFNPRFVPSAGSLGVLLWVVLQCCVCFDRWGPAERGWGQSSGHWASLGTAELDQGPGLPQNGCWEWQKMHEHDDEAWDFLWFFEVSSCPQDFP